MDGKAPFSCHQFLFFSRTGYIHRYYMNNGCSESWKWKKNFLMTKFLAQSPACRSLPTLVWRQSHGEGKDHQTENCVMKFQHLSISLHVSRVPLTHNKEPGWSLSILGEHLCGQRLKNMQMECQRKSCLRREAALKPNSTSAKKNKENWLLS